MIDSFTCYKAKSQLINSTSGKINPNPMFSITTWYTPEIPFSFEPRSCGGLSGLILELQQGSASTFYAKKISLNLEIGSKIDPLKSQKAISNETLSDILSGSLKNNNWKQLKNKSKKLFQIEI
jgi:GLPGLI family protein